MPSRLRLTTGSSSSRVFLGDCTGPTDFGQFIIDSTTLLRTDTLIAEECIQSVVVNAEATRLYVMNTFPVEVQAIDVETGSATFGDTLWSVGTGSVAFQLVLTPDGEKIYGADFINDQVFVISTSTTSLLTPVPVGSSPRSVAIIPDVAGVPAASMWGHIAVAIAVLFVAIGVRPWN